MIFVGDGAIVPAARELVNRHGLTNTVSFLGFVSDRRRLVQCIASCDICLSPEPRNALNDHSTLIKVAEYMSVGKPVVGFDLRETAATLGPGAPLAATINDFAEVIDRLLDDPARREALGRAGRERVLTKFCWQHSERSLLSAYEHALARARARLESRHAR
jgi:glycosyltransferase involved in cell wall biosynthesis